MKKEDKPSFKRTIFKNILIILVGLFLVLGTINMIGNPFELFRLHKGIGNGYGNVAMGGFIGLFFLIAGIYNIIKLIKNNKS